MSVLLIGLVLGLVAVASNPSPYFAAFGLVAVAGMGCGVLVGHGGSFLSLVLFLIYLGGMLVVFAYSAALAAEPYPESWGSRSVVISTVVYLMGVISSFLLSLDKWEDVCGYSSEEDDEFNILRGDAMGVAWLYSVGGGLLVLGGGALLLALFAVLELTRGLSRGALRAV
uniref:NADH-ubiquinone oxidoreductase chain 6 n=1 Tax=Hoplolatilus cuniculus TaxID=1206906 RepID=A0A060NSY5_9TELE|nr:NADH dehydrogenase subunit 6 [Hoplolatilus cuniculus]BAO84847.1 NADH dehydrogenase subunit 6 [Hoplolatilus cuniculus]